MFPEADSASWRRGRHKGGFLAGCFGRPLGNWAILFHPGNPTLSGLSLWVSKATWLTPWSDSSPRVAGWTEHRPWHWEWLALGLDLPHTSCTALHAAHSMELQYLCTEGVWLGGLSKSPPARKYNLDVRLTSMQGKFESGCQFYSDKEERKDTHQPQYTSVTNTCLCFCPLITKWFSLTHTPLLKRG